MEISVKWLSSQSWFKIRTGNYIIHIDPVMYRTYAGVEEELTEKADLILITHSHYDHCEAETIVKLLKPETVLVGTEACKERFRSALRVVHPGDAFQLNKINIRVVHAYNLSKHYHPKGFGVGYILSVDGKNIYHAGDTDLIPEMRQIKNIDLAMIPIGGTYTMDYNEAAGAMEVVRPKYVIPMHKLESDPQKFRQIIGKMEGVNAVILEPGGEFIL